VRPLLWTGIVLVVAIVAAIAFWFPVTASGGVGTKEAGAAFLGLVLLVVAVLGPDWRDWF
jgi:hypothetical protein